MNRHRDSGPIPVPGPPPRWMSLGRLRAEDCHRDARGRDIGFWSCVYQWAMKFGHVSSPEDIDFSLAPEPRLNRELLGGTAAPELEIYVGAPVWNAKSWRGRIYPRGAPVTAFLRHYARYFSCVELNTSHYRIPSTATVAKWRADVGAEFLFCSKIFKGISHERHGLRNLALIDDWHRYVEDLGLHAGPSFLQLPPYFDYSHKQDLFNFVERWPRHRALALEFRHPDWFEGGQIRPALVRYLHSRGIALVITDVAGRRDVSHASLSHSSVLLRFVGSDLHPSDFSRASSWAERFEVWRQEGLNRLYLFIHEPEDRAVPEMTEIFFRQLVGQPGFRVLKQVAEPIEPQLFMNV